MLNYLDTVARKILTIYTNTLWSKFNRTGLGVIGVILLPFLWNYALQSEDLNASGFLILLFFTISVIINVLPISAGIYAFVRTSILEKHLEKDPLFLASIKHKVANNEPLTDHESGYYLADIIKRKLKGEQLFGAELSAYIMSSEENFEEFLFRSSDENFVFSIRELRKVLRDEEFEKLLQVFYQKVPRRMNQLFKSNSS